MKKYLVSLPLLPMWLICSSLATGEAQPEQTTAHDKGGMNAAGSARQLDTPGQITDKIKALQIYSVEEGEINEKLYLQKDLQTGDDLKVAGHVFGIVVLCEDDMAITVDGKKMSKIKRNLDGTYSVKRFGKIAPDNVVLANLSEGIFLYNNRDNEFLPGAFSYFSHVAGDSLSPHDTFDIGFKSEEETYKISVRQNGYRTVRSVCVNSGAKTNDIMFRYLGTRLEKLAAMAPDFDSRLQAIAEGIDSVESILGEDLVTNVNIVDFENVRNAVVCDDARDIWFYSEAVQSESPEELRSMAAHETLHIYVDRHGIARNSEVREFFADLNGYDDLSYERFMIVTSGEVSPERSSTPHNPIFPFVNEQNFLEGMKGGHSHKNVDEFCVSLLHSLMFVDRLEQNLDRPLKSQYAEKRSLTPAEKDSVLHSYLRGIDLLIGAISDDKTDTPDSRDFLETSLRKARNASLKL